MTFSQSVRKCFSSYANFSGRASRSEYWWFTLFYTLVTVVLSVLGFVCFATAEQFEPGGFSSIILGVGWVFFGTLGVFILATLIPGWAVGVRRFHDRNMSGWIYFGLILAGAIPLLSLVTSIAFIVITVMKGTPGPNRYGLDPLNPSSADVFT